MMKMTEADFNALVDRAMRDPQTAQLEPVIRKELLHYDILFCLDQSGMLDDLIFQGGTSLRLCYGSRRYSEDPDFAGGREFSSAALKDMKSALENYLVARYGLEVNIKEPSALKQEANYSALNIDKWQVSVVTNPERRDLPRQRIKIDVANIPAYTREVHALRKNYPFLPDGYDDILIAVESMDEIMADKLVSLAVAKPVRYRDIWDLAWLQQQGADIRPDLVENKIRDYRVSGYPDMIDNIIDQCPSVIDGASFQNQMRRFLPTDIYQQTLARDRYKEALSRSLTGLYRELKQRLL